MKKRVNQGKIQAVIKYIKIILLVLIILFSINMTLLIMLSMTFE